MIILLIAELTMSLLITEFTMACSFIVWLTMVSGLICWLPMVSSVILWLINFILPIGAVDWLRYLNFNRFMIDYLRMMVFPLNRLILVFGCYRLK